MSLLEQKAATIGTELYPAAESSGRLARLANRLVGTDMFDPDWSLGGVFIGQPWEVKLPTDLVTLEGAPALT